MNCQEVVTGHQSRKNQPTDRRISGSSDPRELVWRGWFINVSTDWPILQSCPNWRKLPCAVPMAMLKLSIPSQKTRNCQQWTYSVIRRDKQLKNDAVRVTGYGQAHAMPILDAGLQICLPAVYTKPVKHEKRKWRRQKSRTEKPPGGRGSQRTKGSHYVYGEKSVSKEQKNARNKWLRGCTMRPTEGYRKP